MRYRVKFTIEKKKEEGSQWGGLLEKRRFGRSLMQVGGTSHELKRWKEADAGKCGVLEYSRSRPHAPTDTVQTGKKGRRREQGTQLMGGYNTV